MTKNLVIIHRVRNQLNIATATVFTQLQIYLMKIKTLSNMGSYSTQMSHTYELMHARTLTSTQTLWNQRGHRSQPTHDTRTDLFFPRGGSSALHTAQISSTCSSAGSATSPLDDAEEVDGCGNCGGGCNGWSSIFISYCSATPTKAMPTN